MVTVKVNEESELLWRGNVFANPVIFKICVMKQDVLKYN